MAVYLQISNAGSQTAEIERLAAISKSRRVWLQVGRLIDGHSEVVHRDANIVFDAVQIQDVTTDGEQRNVEQLPAGVHQPDAVLSDYTMLPCLIEAHAHLFLQGGTIDLEQRKQYLKSSTDQLLGDARSRLSALLAHGVATVRDAGDKDGVGLALAAEARPRRGMVSDTPWIDSPGAALHHRGRYGAFMGEPIEDHGSLEACIAARCAAGADRIKLLVSGIIDFKVGDVTTSPQLDADEVASIVRAATAHGRPTFAHASGIAGIENSIVGGVNTVEHGFFITQDQLARMRDANIAWVPTFAPIIVQIEFADHFGWSSQVVTNLQRIIEGHQRMLRSAHAMGVTVLAGSDAGSCGVPHGNGLLDEMRYMEEAGLPTMSVLQSATGTSAKSLAFAEPVGRIAQGCRSRFILTRHDPLTSVSQLKLEKSVVFDGRVISGDAEMNAEML